MLRRLGREYPFHLMILPGAILVLVYCYVPMLGVILAFKNYSPIIGFFESEWVGFANFVYMFQMPSVGQVIRNTFFLAFMELMAGLIVPVIVALLLNEMHNKRMKKSIQTVIYLPHFLSWVILSGILLDVLSLHGIVNQLLGFIGFKPIFFLGSDRWFPLTLISSQIWKEFGFAAIVYLAALTGIDPALYEAAHIDGANRWEQMRNITLPELLPIVLVVLTISLGSVLDGMFDQVFNLYSPAVYGSGDILDTLIYRVGLQDSQFSVSTALGLFKSAVSFILVSTSYWFAYRFASYRIF